MPPKRKRRVENSNTTPAQRETIRNRKDKILPGDRCQDESDEEESTVKKVYKNGPGISYVIFMPLLYTCACCCVIYQANEKWIKDTLGFGEPWSNRTDLWRGFEGVPEFSDKNKSLENLNFNNTTQVDSSVAQQKQQNQNQKNENKQFNNAFAAFGASSLPAHDLKNFAQQAQTILNQNRTAVVIGAGFSGLTASLELKRRGFGRVVVFDRNKKPGGRAVSFSSVEGMQEIFSSQEQEQEVKNKKEQKNKNTLGFQFDFGPSWYWMPDVFDSVFQRFGRKRSDYYELKRLDPAYRLYDQEEKFDVPGKPENFFDFVTSLEVEQNENEKQSSSSSSSTSNAISLRLLLGEAKIKYQKGIQNWIWKPMVSFYEFIDFGLMQAGICYDMFGGFSKHLKRFFSQNFEDENKILHKILNWPVIFVGASPESSPAMYSLMTFGGHLGGTWYPIQKTKISEEKSGLQVQNGLSAPALALHQVAIEQGIEFFLEHDVVNFEFKNEEEKDFVTAVCYKNNLEQQDVVKNKQISCIKKPDIVIASGDYHHIEQKLLPEKFRTQSEENWQQENVMSPSTLLFYVGLDKKIEGLLHHTFFFSSDLQEHFELVFQELVEKDLVSTSERIVGDESFEPLFYVSATSKTDQKVVFNTVDDEIENRTVDGEALFLLVPVPFRYDEYESKILQNDKNKIEEEREILLQKLLKIMTKKLNLNENFFKEHIVFNKNFGPSEFVQNFNSFRGNAFGHANILTQSLIMKPPLESKVQNLVFAGQLTNPGPGVYFHKIQKKQNTKKKMKKSKISKNKMLQKLCSR